MIIEERNDVAIITGTQEEIEAYKAEHGLKRGEGMCILAADVAADIVGKEVLNTGYYKEKIESQATRIQELEKENDKLNAYLLKAESKIKGQDEKISKLERAVIDAAIR